MAQLKILLRECNFWFCVENSAPNSKKPLVPIPQTVTRNDTLCWRKVIFILKTFAV